jgi:excisionase family DNA binding protein
VTLDKLLTVKELCEWLSVEPVWVYRQTREDTIPYIKVGKYLRFSKPAIEKYIKENTNQPEN